MNGSDHWNTPCAEATGGISSRDGYLTIAERSNAGGQPNENLYLAHDLAGQGRSDSMLSNGVTISFRTRLSANSTYPTADGFGVMKSGKGMFGISAAAVNPDYPKGVGILKRTDESLRRYSNPACRGILRNRRLDGSPR